MFDGSRLKAARRRTGLNQKEAASELGIPVGTYRNWEQSLHEPHSGHIISIVKLFNTTADFILGLTDNPEPYSKTKKTYQHAAYDGALDDLTDEEKEELLMTVAIRREIMRKRRAQRDEQS